MHIAHTVCRNGKSCLILVWITKATNFQLFICLPDASTKHSAFLLHAALFCGRNSQECCIRPDTNSLRGTCLLGFKSASPPDAFSVAASVLGRMALDRPSCQHKPAQNEEEQSHFCSSASEKCWLEETLWGIFLSRLLRRLIALFHKAHSPFSLVFLVLCCYWLPYSLRFIQLYLSSAVVQLV